MILHGAIMITFMDKNLNIYFFELSAMPRFFLSYLYMMEKKFSFGYY